MGRQSKPIGVCVDCSVLAGPGYLVTQLGEDGRCPSCAYYFDKYGAALTERESKWLTWSWSKERRKNESR